MRFRQTTIALASLLCLALAPALAQAAGPPQVLSTSFSQIGTDSATLEAKIDPQGKATRYHFEYGPSNCASNPCTSLPLPPEPQIGGSSSPTLVSVHIEGLDPHSTYHFRAVAKNSESPSPVTGPDVAFTTYVLESPLEPCPNDIFRVGQGAALPDCRAYEQASPVDKNGADVNGDSDQVQAASGGGAVVFSSAAGLPGAIGAQDFSTYLARRGAGGWSTEGVYPPASAGPVARNAGWTPDLAQFFSKAAETFSGPWSFLSRSSSDGSFTSVISPVASTITLAGASADGSKVFFQNNGQLTPGGAPGKENLYVWDRDTGAVSLAGVLPDSACATPPCVPPAGSFAGPYNWFQGTNATTLGQGGPSGGASNDPRYYTQDEHAISSDGSKAYFTAAGSGQIYLRKDATGPGASAVQVSASQRSTPDPLGTRPAAFLAATLDGSQAFFTSPEKLTDDANTGPEPVGTPAIARADLDGNPTSVDLSFLPTHASGITVDAEHIYWANPKANTIGRADLDGNPTSVDQDFIEASFDFHGISQEKPYTYNRHNPRGIAVDSTHIYWGDMGKAGNTTSALMRAKIDGSDVEEYGEKENRPGELEPSEFAPIGLAIQGNYIYFSQCEGREKKEGGCNINRQSLTDPLDKKALAFTSDSGWRGVAVDGSHLYVADVETDTIFRSNLLGAEANPEFIAGAGHPKGLAVDVSHVYWSAYQDVIPNPGNDLYRFDAAAGALTDLTPDPTDTNGAEVKGLLGASADGSYLYFAANGDLDGPGGPASPGNCQARLGQETLASSGACSLYLSHAGAITFIAPLDAKKGGGSSDAADWEPAGARLDAPQSVARVSADGKTLLFRSQGQLSAYDNKGVAEFYRYHVGDPGFLCVTCNPTGAPPTGAATLQSIQPFIQVVDPPGSPPILTRNLSTDGNRVFFESAEKLVAADTNGDDGCPSAGQAKVPSCQDVYEWEAEGSGSCRSSAQNGGCLYLLSSGAGAEPAFFADASAAGEDAFIFTRDTLVPQDQDQLLDVYDARAGGGLASQHPPAPVSCEAEGCKGGASASPAFQSPGSAAFAGPGNPPVNRKARCPKGKRRVRAKGGVHCLAKKHHKRQRRDAKTTGRAGR